MAVDQLEYFGKSLIQHGPANNRVYLMKLALEDVKAVLDHIHGLARRCGYTKIFAKVPAAVKTEFKAAGYRVEAAVPGFYGGKEDGLFLAKYYDKNRLIDSAGKRIEEVLQTARKKSPEPPAQANDNQLSCRLATPDDCQQMSTLYAQVFASYPFPIDDPIYLQKTMAENIIYAGIWEDDQLLALASAEMDRKAANAEMTDFATLPDHRSGGLAGELLCYLEKHIAKMNIRTCYTIARATSYGMNIAFARNGYDYCGTLVNNTQISGSLESMNVWSKTL